MTHEAEALSGPVEVSTAPVFPPGPVRGTPVEQAADKVAPKDTSRTRDIIGRPPKYYFGPPPVAIIGGAVAVIGMVGWYAFKRLRQSQRNPKSHIIL